jgi:hypothetical protein
MSRPAVAGAGLQGMGTTLPCRCDASGKNSGIETPGRRIGHHRPRFSDARRPPHTRTAEHPAAQRYRLAVSTGQGW